MTKPASNQAPQALALMYHSIADWKADPWKISVSPQNFEAQIKFLASHYNVVSVAELLQRLQANSLEEKTVCLTFDDGYADNYYHAKPVLERYDCAATFFIATAFINSAKNFWWDELEAIFLHSKKLPSHLQLCIGDSTHNYFFSETELSPQQCTAQAAWKWYEAPPTDRCSAFFDIWEKLRPLPNAEIEKQICYLKNWSGEDKINDHRLPMSDEELKILASNNLFTIGLHTHTHPDLCGKEKNFQHEEIQICKNILQAKYGVEANYFAYPYGRHDEETVKLSEQLSLHCCFTTDEKSIVASDDLFRLGRYQVCNWNADEFEKQMRAFAYEKCIPKNCLQRK